MSTKLFLPLKGRGPTPLGSAGRGETVAGRWAEPPASLLGTGRKAGWVNIRANSHTHTHIFINILQGKAEFPEVAAPLL